MSYILRVAAFAAIFAGYHPLMVSPAQAEPRFDTCRPAEIMAFTQRVHVRCETPVHGFAFFAFPAAFPAAGQMLSVLNTAAVTGRDVTVLYDPADTSGAAIGCLVNDCRTLLAVGFWR